MRKLLVLTIILIGTFPTLSNAVELTIYDDGKSCPENCDAHVVFHPSLNGTNNAHIPSSTGSNFEKCSNGSVCEICFTSDSSQCIEVMYRGNGPGRNTFDLTPNFYTKWCEKEGIPKKLENKCSSLKMTAAKLSGRINCIAEQSHHQCIELISSAKRSKDEDAPKYQSCIEMGEHAYNRGKPKSERRKHKCAYEDESNGGPNSRGLTWRKLLPAACRKNTYVGKDGLDCCSGNTFADGSLQIECRNFYPKSQ